MSLYPTGGSGLFSRASSKSGIVPSSRSYDSHSQLHAGFVQSVSSESGCDTVNNSHGTNTNDQLYSNNQQAAVDLQTFPYDSSFVFPADFVSAVYSQLVQGQQVDNNVLQFTPAELSVFLSSSDFQALLSQSRLFNQRSSDDYIQPMDIAAIVLSLLDNKDNEGEKEDNVNEQSIHEASPSVCCVTCGIIPDNYLELNCSHSFCLNCMANWFREKDYISLTCEINLEFEVECPICTIPLTLLDVDSVQAVRETMKLLQTVEAVQEKNRNERVVLPRPSLLAEIIYEESSETCQTEEETGRNRTTCSSNHVRLNTDKRPSIRQQQIESQASTMQVEGQQKFHTPSHSQQSAASSVTTAPLSQPSLPSQGDNMLKKRVDRAAAVLSREPPRDTASNIPLSKQSSEKSRASSPPLSPLPPPLLIVDSLEEDLLLDHVKEEKQHACSQIVNWQCPSHPRNQVGFVNFSRMCCVCVRCLQSGDCAHQDIASLANSLPRMRQLSTTYHQQTQLYLNILSLQQQPPHQRRSSSSEPTSQAAASLQTISSQIETIITCIENKRCELLQRSAVPEPVETERLSLEKGLTLLNNIEKQFASINARTALNMNEAFFAFASAVDGFNAFIQDYRDALTPRLNLKARDRFKELQAAASTEAAAAAENTSREAASNIDFADQIDALQKKISQLNPIGVLARNPSIVPPRRHTRAQTQQQQSPKKLTVKHNINYAANNKAYSQPYFYKSSSQQVLQSMLFAPSKQRGKRSEVTAFDQMRVQGSRGGGGGSLLLWTDDEEYSRPSLQLLRSGKRGEVLAKSSESLARQTSNVTLQKYYQVQQLAKNVHATGFKQGGTSLNQSGASTKHLNTTDTGQINLSGYFYTGDEKQKQKKNFSTGVDEDISSITDPFRKLLLTDPDRRHNQNKFALHPPSLIAGENSTGYSIKRGQFARDLDNLMKRTQLFERNVQVFSAKPTRDSSEQKAKASSDKISSYLSRSKGTPHKYLLNGSGSTSSDKSSSSFSQQATAGNNQQSHRTQRRESYTSSASVSKPASRAVATTIMQPSKSKNGKEARIGRNKAVLLGASEGVQFGWSSSYAKSMNKPTSSNTAASSSATCLSLQSYSNLFNSQKSSY